MGSSISEDGFFNWLREYAGAGVTRGIAQIMVLIFVMILIVVFGVEYEETAPAETGTEAPTSEPPTGATTPTTPRTADAPAPAPAPAPARPLLQGGVPVGGEASAMALPSCQLPASAFRLSRGHAAFHYGEQQDHYFYLRSDGDTLEIGYIDANGPQLEEVEQISTYQPGTWHPLHVLVGEATFYMCYDAEGLYGGVD